MVFSKRAQSAIIPRNTRLSTSRCKHQHACNCQCLSSPNADRHNYTALLTDKTHGDLAYKVDNLKQFSISQALFDQYALSTISKKKQKVKQNNNCQNNKMKQMFLLKSLSYKLKKVPNKQKIYTNCSQLRSQNKNYIFFEPSKMLRPKSKQFLKRAIQNAKQQNELIEFALQQSQNKQNYNSAKISSINILKLYRGKQKSKKFKQLSFSPLRNNGNITFLEQMNSNNPKKNQFLGKKSIASAKTKASSNA